ncbi:MAG: tRNA (guanine(10)-N2)-dimethyltransferase [Candidatus Methanofastidiosum methylothiophilum]|jgi:tRNA (guanine10-N2)-dimethyltransferase|uniref:tRNA (guanine(10)-N(2))-dimethyltransferase n=1 Tax=Candidatus Methanofastidiosum methylothiophilum TaxID=1705564 RepID=A0A150JLZ9_9EURY|nr:MAG: tRNA (guanine(10)-N2)-dimethyltransferase [Candidatus Methanofastidiosum methylthiophilus]MBP6931939.1 N-6 DNA methylase [Methanofastidiosum sp.]OQC52555.1 MAG: tRNA (guanine(10)-N2)-dimethyltransferase [Euryarchaeota archaeon ADurb.Bin023]KYC57138.1 MAG: tRNA (guanine(10)-N2)-dimethyltransferase [Candidatus Methanofastidiosum methylthiophilus]KYC57894.1 MAG: tRNA (guanine(10)-N2)-dimethyltransferase [Candidatus Methanofastidiosum methylthiophilus]
MKVLFFLSGNNIFAKDEVFSLFESYELKYEIIYDEGQLLILKISKSNIDFISRLGLTHFVLDVICDFDIDKKINENIFDIDWDSRLSLDRTYKVRVKNKDKIEYGNLELIIAKSISNFFKDKIKANLTNPMDEIVGIIFRHRLFIGKKIFERNKEGFNIRKPQLRPFFSPTSIDPRIARAMINISQAQKEILDPFVGTGGILIEAGLMGLDTYGIDIEEKSVIGTKMNLLNYEINSFDIRLGDARKILEIFGRTFESIATDAPYGRSTKIDKDKEKMYNECFSSIRESFKKKCMIGLDREYPFEDIGFKIDKVYSFRVHKSLIRHFYLLS